MDANIIQIILVFTLAFFSLVATIATYYYYQGEGNSQYFLIFGVFMTLAFFIAGIALIYVYNTHTWG